MDNLLTSGPAKDHFFLHLRLAMIQTSFDYGYELPYGTPMESRETFLSPSFKKGASKMGIRSPQNCHGDISGCKK